jgi:hypothetical protein
MWAGIRILENNPEFFDRFADEGHHEPALSAIMAETPKRSSSKRSLNANGHDSPAVACPLWVINGHCRLISECPRYPRKADLIENRRHVR